MNIPPVLRDVHGRWERWKRRSWFSMLSTGRHFHGSFSYCALASDRGQVFFRPNYDCPRSASFLCRSRVRRKRYDSVPVSRMCARSVMRSSRALHNRAFGIACVHSEKARFLVKTTAILSARSAITGAASAFCFKSDQALIPSPQ